MCFADGCLLSASVRASVSDGAPVISAVFIGSFSRSVSVSLCFSVCLRLSFTSFLPSLRKHEKGTKTSEYSLSWMCSAWCNPKNERLCSDTAFPLMPCPSLLRDFLIMHHLKVHFKAALLKLKELVCVVSFSYNFASSSWFILLTGTSNFLWNSVTLEDSAWTTTSLAANKIQSVAEQEKAQVRVYTHTDGFIVFCTIKQNRIVPVCPDYANTCFPSPSLQPLHAGLGLLWTLTLPLANISIVLFPLIVTLAAFSS